ncbi:MAG TPA: molybdenum cofactor guanylyltransferase MobA [Gammaproteobacteria bacterium]|nr:molybdenum cofactor guanylyltransferase MobA [Gammaproteobacteria bacterium]
MSPEDRQLLCGVVLAGGLARRMGGQDKGLVKLGSHPMVSYVLARLAPQVGDLVINANRSRDRYQAFGYPVIADSVGDYSGPLAGMASAMAHTDRPLLLTAPCDTPLLSEQLAERLLAALREQDGEIAVAHDGSRLQPVFALLDVTLLSSLQEYLAAGERKIDRWYADHRLATADFSDQRDAFLNVNTVEERDSLLARLEGLAPCP